jgi:uncharacterized protein with von Willebrand factor type A (vWA) domain
MATIERTAGVYFQHSGKSFVEVPLPPIEGVSNNVICVVDVSGSMAGAPIKMVSAVRARSFLAKAPRV